MSPDHRSLHRHRGRTTTPGTARRAVLLWSLAGGFLVPVYYLLFADVSHLAWDFRAYHAAAEAVLRGESFVGISPGIPGVAYVYPPLSVALFVPQAAVGGWRTAFALQTVVNLAAAVAVSALTLQTIEAHSGRLPRTDRVLVTGLCVGSAPIAAVIGLGQVDTLVALALAGAFVALERGRDDVAGAALAGAALVKVFPAALGLWLVWRRAWRALTAALVTGLAGLGLGALWFGLDAYARYLDVLAGRSRVSEFAGSMSPNFFAMTLSRPLSRALPGVDPMLYPLISALALAPVVCFVACSERGFIGRVRTYLVVLATVLLVSPASNTLYVAYLYFPLCCLLYADSAGRGGWLLVVGTALLTVPLQPAHVATVLSTVGAPPPFTTWILPALRTTLGVVSVPLVGLLVVLVGCALRATHCPDTVDVGVRPSKSD